MSTVSQLFCENITSDGPPLQVVIHYLFPCSLLSLSFFLLNFSCDADPSALAKYVVALVKKDKSEKELKALCIDQLDVFLQKGNIPQLQFVGLGHYNTGTPVVLIVLVLQRFF